MLELITEVAQAEGISIDDLMRKAFAFYYKNIYLPIKNNSVEEPPQWCPLCKKYTVTSANMYCCTVCSWDRHV